MTAIRSMETARTEDMTAKPAVRGRARAIVAAATVAACSLLAAPLQADEVWNVTVTLTHTIVNGEVRLDMTLTGHDATWFSSPAAEVGLQYRQKGTVTDEGWFDWGPWRTIGNDTDTANVVINDHFGYGPGPYYFQGQAYLARASTTFTSPSITGVQFFTSNPTEEVGPVDLGSD